MKYVSGISRVLRCTVGDTRVILSFRNMLKNGRQKGRRRLSLPQNDKFALSPSVTFPFFSTQFSSSFIFHIPPLNFLHSLHFRFVPLKLDFTFFP